MVGSPHNNSSFVPCSFREFSENFPRPPVLGLFIKPFRTAKSTPHYFHIVCAQKCACNCSRIKVNSPEQFKFQPFCRSWTKVYTVLTQGGDGYRTRIESDTASRHEGSNRYDCDIFLYFLFTTYEYQWIDCDIRYFQYQHKTCSCCLTLPNVYFAFSHLFTLWCCLRQLRYRYQ